MLSFTITLWVRPLSLSWVWWRRRRVVTIVVALGVRRMRFVGLGWLWRRRVVVAIGHCVAYTKVSEKHVNGVSLG